MDSVTQAVLGAAVGELFFGKQLGNRALLWGAVAGTIPDMDVVSRLFTQHDVYGLIYHRGLSHSILFTVLMPFLLAWLAKRYYDKRSNQRVGVQNLWAGLWTVFYASFAFLSVFIAYRLPSALTLGVSGAILAGSYFWWRSTMRVRTESLTFTANTQYKTWYLMFFFAIFTHWLIDACTAYGTQIFEPFSSYRVAFNNISIVDPLYTTPFLVFLTAVYFSRTARWRKIFNGLALGLSTSYMAFTFYAKHQVNLVVEQNLAAQGIKYTTYNTTPTILNTILWQTMVETPDSFYFGVYSLLDRRKEMEFVSIPKNHHLVEPYKKEPLVDILLWFAQGYYSVTQNPDGTLRFNNLRFGLALASTDTKDWRYIVGYNIGTNPNKNGAFDVWQTGDERRLDVEKMLSAFWTRLKGLD